MKTILISLCWLGEPWRIDRYQRWLDYNLKIKDQLGFDRIFLLDNASDPKDLAHIEGKSGVSIHRFDTHLPRTAMLEYPYIWRGIEFTKSIIKLYKPEKIYFIDSDCYVLTPKLATYLNSIDRGWEAFWTRTYGFPETNLQILCKDQFKAFMDFPIPSYDFYHGQLFENLLPFTKVNKDGWMGDRYGEFMVIPKQGSFMDFYAQWKPESGEMVYDLANVKTD